MVQTCITHNARNIIAIMDSPEIKSSILLWQLPLGSSLSQPRELGLLGGINEASKQLPGGAYTTLRTYGGVRVLRLGDHISRLNDSARLQGVAISIDSATLMAALGTTVRYPSRDRDTQEYRLRIILDLEEKIGDLYILREKLVVPSAHEYQYGVRVGISSLRRGQPEAKLTSFLTETAKHPPPENANEALLVDAAANILEGLSSNFFAVIDNEIHTAGEGILKGITREIILEVIEEFGISLLLKAPNLVDVPRMDEAFISSSSRGVLPVVQIGAQILRSGSPGPISKLVSSGFLKHIENELETL